MATQVGVVKQISGVVVAVDANGNQRTLNVGDQVFLGEAIKTQGSSSSVTLALNNGKEISIFGNDEIALDQSTTNAQSFDGNTVADVSALQQAILQSEELEGLEETAAGGDNGGGTNSDGTFLAGTKKPAKIGRASCRERV